MIASGSWLPIVAMVLVGYALGSIPFAWILARRLRGVDLRSRGSGNLGAANAFRATGTLIGLVTLALDVAKGAATVLLAQRLSGGVGAAMPTAAGLAAVAGHVYPVWLRFRGGKGVATACGAFAVLAPLATACAGLLFVVTIWWTRYVSVGSVVGTVALGPIAYFAEAPAEVVGGAVAVAVVILTRHRANLRRVRAGVERRFGQGPAAHD
jgi:glycerol-3-phosphate acyltransferase PlsY